MLKIGLTGGMGSGKSTVAKIFETLGIPVYYADDAAKNLMNSDETLKGSIRQNFGEEAYVDGKLNRSWLAALVFNDPVKLDLLNKLTHPATIRDAAEWMAGQKAPYVIKEAALLFESGADRGMDKVIGVSAPLPLRIKRLVERDHTAEAEIMKRISRQMDEEEKLKRCDFVLINDEKHLLIPQVLELDKRFKTFNKQ
jgi:dephospho-CoA kinase